MSRSGNRIELLDTPPRGPSGVRLATGDEQLEIMLDERRGEIALKVYARGAPPGSSAPCRSAAPGSRSTRVSGDIHLKGKQVTVSGKTGVTVDGGLLAVLKAALVRIN